MINMAIRIIGRTDETLKFTESEEGLVELLVPEYYTDKDIERYFETFDANYISSLLCKQRKHTAVFRKSINDLIYKYINEYRLPITRINLRLSNRTKKMLNYHFSVYSWMTEGIISLPAFLEYYPMELVEVMVGFGVACIAVEYEYNMHCLNECRPVLEVSSASDSRIKYVPITEEEKYSVPFDDNELDLMIKEYIKVASQIAYDNKLHPIYMVRMSHTSHGLKSVRKGIW